MVLRQTRKRKRDENHAFFVITSITASLNKKSVKRHHLAYISSGSEGVAYSLKKYIKTLIKGESDREKRHHRVNFTSSSQKCEKRIGEKIVTSLFSVNKDKN